MMDAMTELGIHERDVEIANLKHDLESYMEAANGYLAENERLRAAVNLAIDWVLAKPELHDLEPPELIMKLRGALTA